ncbi:uncharacterized protein FSUBG_12354 [Fusarium subglutinans]|uniref:Uncharacterized protein n=1 Tax=Gibberella subglutinans TaxID=42677 RepID=A0A8H5L3N9_GIBSU|nr:uncharacterized protein FSUBG_12354 [Fusarium subglutinans]KAF5585765.1 hypothetical protein FSUBG_12354 [Fusarium subglutinans]
MSLPIAPLDPSAIPAGNTNQRRAYITQFLGRLGKTYLQQAPEEFRISKELAMAKLAKHRVRQVGTAYFEYNVDKVAWFNLFRRLKDDAPVWPWSKGPEIDDMSDGMSVTYNKWRIDHDLPVTPAEETETPSGTSNAAENNPEVTKPATTKTQTRNGESCQPQIEAPQSVARSSKAQVSGDESSQSMVRINQYSARPTPRHLEDALVPSTLDTASPVHSQVDLPVASQPAAVNARERIENPVVLDMAVRQRFWETSSGGPYTGVIAGPFTLNLPVWLNFERLVVGEDGRDIDAINNEILEPGVAISWEVSGGKPLCLVVGFTNETSSMLPQLQQHLFEVWCDVVAWFCSAVSGSSVSLAPYLRVIQVSLWQESLAESDLFASRARQARECFEFWSPMIREVIQQPLGVAEQSLAAWICNEETDSDERTKRLNVARDVWLSSSSDPKVIRRATKWIQNFLGTLEPST